MNPYVYVLFFCLMCCAFLNVLCSYVIAIWIGLDELEAEDGLDVQRDLHLPLVDHGLLLHLLPLLLIRISCLLS